MHRVQNVIVDSIHRRPYKVARRDSLGDVIWEDEERNLPESKEGTVEDVLKMLITQSPPDTITKQDSIHGDRLWGQMYESMKSIANEDETVGVLEIEDAEFDWIMKCLDDDKKGPKVFGINCYRIERTIRDAEIKKEDPPEVKPDIEPAETPTDD